MFWQFAARTTRGFGSLGRIGLVGSFGLVGCAYTDVVALTDNTGDTSRRSDAEATGETAPSRAEDAAETTGSSDASPEDAADVEGGTGCGGVYCFGFEEPAVTSENVELVEREGSLRQDCTRAHTGACSGAATLTASGGVAYLAMDVPPAQGQWFVRAYVWLPSELVVDDLAIIHVGTRGGNAGVNVDLRDAERLELFAIESEQASLTPEGVTRRQEWMCLLVEVLTSDVAGQASLSVDGETVLQESGVDTSPPNGTEFITVGIDWSSGNQPTGTLWFDDVVVSNERVACE